MVQCVRLSVWHKRSRCEKEEKNTPNSDANTLPSKCPFRAKEVVGCLCICCLCFFQCVFLWFFPSSLDVSWWFCKPLMRNSFRALFNFRTWSIWRNISVVGWLWNDVQRPPSAICFANLFLVPLAKVSLFHAAKLVIYSRACNQQPLSANYHLWRTPRNRTKNVAGRALKRNYSKATRSAHCVEILNGIMSHLERGP